jgi:hypothetical protein
MATRSWPQPTLHYGVLSSKDDLDVTAAAAVAAARQKLGVEPLYYKVEVTEINLDT